MRNVVLVAFVVITATSIVSAQSSRHAFTFDDAATLRSASAVSVSPDGKSALYAVRFGGSKGPTNTEWNLIPIAGGESRHLNLPDREWHSSLRAHRSQQGAAACDHALGAAQHSRSSCGHTRSTHYIAARDSLCPDLSRWQPLRRSGRSAPA